MRHNQIRNIITIACCALFFLIIFWHFPNTIYACDPNKLTIAPEVLENADTPLTFSISGCSANELIVVSVIDTKNNHQMIYGSPIKFFPSSNGTASRTIQNFMPVDRIKNITYPFQGKLVIMTSDFRKIATKELTQLLSPAPAPPPPSAPTTSQLPTLTQGPVPSPISIPPTQTLAPSPAPPPPSTPTTSQLPTLTQGPVPSPISIPPTSAPRSSDYRFIVNNCGNGSNNGIGVLTAIGCISGNVGKLTATFLRIGIGIAGGLAFLLIIFGGLRIILSSGHPEAMMEGREIVTSAIVGLLLIIFSVFLLRFISVDVLKLPGFSAEQTQTSPTQE